MSAGPRDRHGVERVSRDELRRLILDRINEVLVEDDREPRAPADHEQLLEAFDIESLDLAVVVVRLEQQLGVDPFRDGDASVRTVGDFIGAYTAAVGTSSSC